MNNFTIIPHDDIELFLLKYNQSISNDKIQNYKNAYNLINKVAFGPESIANWINSYNEFITISNLLIFEDIPDDIISQFMDKLDIENIMKSCQLSPHMKSFCDRKLKEILIKKANTKFHFDFINSSISELYLMSKLIDNPYYTPLVANDILSGILKLNGQCYVFNNDVVSMGYFGLVGTITNNRNIYNVTKSPLELLYFKNMISIVAGQNYLLGLSKEGYAHTIGDYFEIYHINHSIDLNKKHDRINIIGDDLYNVISISSTYKHGLVLNNDGTVYAFGDNTHGQLGMNNKDPINYIISPKQILQLHDIIQIHAGKNNSYFLTKMGEVYACGLNKFGELGLNTYGDILIPTKILGLQNIISICCGEYHTLALKDDGTVYSFGNNNHGQLGLGNKIDTRTPTLISNINNIIQISAGFTSSLLLKNDGTVYGFGSNIHNCLGLNKNNILIPTKLNVTNIIYISTSGVNTMILRKNGIIESFGYTLLPSNFTIN